MWNCVVHIVTTGHLRPCTKDFRLSLQFVLLDCYCDHLLLLPAASVNSVKNHCRAVSPKYQTARCHIAQDSSVVVTAVTSYMHLFLPGLKKGSELEMRVWPQGNMAGHGGDVLLTEPVT